MIHVVSISGCKIFPQILSRFKILLLQESSTRPQTPEHTHSTSPLTGRRHTELEPVTTTELPAHPDCAASLATQPHTYRQLLWCNSHTECDKTVTKQPQTAR